MADPYELESPEQPDDLYAARGEEVTYFHYRPLFTGDILVLNDKKVALLQHPCSMRRGLILVPRLLIADVRVWNEKIPNWSGHLRRMFLPELNPGENWVIEFDSIDLIDTTIARSAERACILSQVGVNLLIQRWINHQSRVIVRTLTINEMIAGQYDEADLLGESTAELVDAGWSVESAVSKIDAWFSEGPRESTRRNSLQDAQKRSAIRKDLRRSVQEWIQYQQG